MRIQQIARSRFTKILSFIWLQPVGLLLYTCAILNWPEYRIAMTALAMFGGVAHIWLVRREVSKIMRTYEAAIRASEENSEALGRAEFEVRVSHDRLLDSEMRFRMIAETIPHMVWTTDPNGDTDYCNAQWIEYTGVGVEDLKKDRPGWQRVIHPDHLARAIEGWKFSQESGTPFRIEFLLRREKDGLYRWHLAQALPVRDSRGRVVRWFGTLTDIEEQKKVFQEAQSAIRLRDEFLSIASHELRTPLTSLSLQLQMIERAFRKTLEIPAIREAHGKVEFTLGQARHLGRLIDTVLDISRLSEGPLALKISEVRVDQVVTEVMARLAPDAAAVGSTLEFSRSLETGDSGRGAIEARLDEARLEQAITNLLSNAIKFGRGRPIDVRLNCDFDGVTLEVQDRGMGILPQDHERIFNRFERAVGHKNVSGLGLGLFVTRQIAEAHGGSITLRSDPEQGSTFILKLPRAGFGKSRPDSKHPQYPQYPQYQGLETSVINGPRMAQVSEIEERA